MSDLLQRRVAPDVRRGTRQPVRRIPLLTSGATRVVLALTLFASTLLAADKKIVLIAGRPSHGPGEHEHRAGCLLLKKCLDQAGGVTSTVYSNGWPQSADAFTGADAVIIYADGGGGHPAIQQDHLKILSDLMNKGVGLGCIHFATEIPKDKGGPELLKWIGGYFEAYWSVNPHWDADFKELPKHPITRGVSPFKIRDEWYYHMRFLEGMKNVTPILTAVPPDDTRGKEGERSSHGGKPDVQARKGMPEHVMWATERADGGRGFGITGAHFHKNWGDENFRRVVLNAVLWIAKSEVPAQGVQSTLTEEDLKANLDPKPRPAKNLRIAQ
jgi:type 1 glutamine amidotransferase